MMESHLDDIQKYQVLISMNSGSVNREKQYHKIENKYDFYKGNK